MHVIPGAHQYSLQERVLFGRPVAEVLPGELRRAGATRVLLVTNASLAQTPAIAAIRESLGAAWGGTFAGIRAHSPREGIVAGARAARECGAELLLAAGGGSVVDATKVMLLCLRHGYTDAAQLDPHANAPWDAGVHRPADADRWLRMMAVPTTFSAAEYTAMGGATDMRTRAKQGFGSPMMVPQVVVNDPAMTCTAPLSLLLSTGMKAIDHAVERLTSNKANLYSDTVSRLGLECLARNLPKLRGEPGASVDGAQLAVRAELQYGVFMAMCGIASGVRGGLSHGIAHAMGAFSDVPHGHTSCVLLPAVMRWIAEAIPERQAAICDALGRPGGDAAAALSGLIASLGLPTRIGELGVRREDLDTIAERSLHDPLVANCPRKVESAAEVREILESAW